MKIGFAIRLMPMPQERITVISEFKLRLFSVITVESSTPIGIVMTKTEGKCRIIIIKASLKGIPYLAICLRSVRNVSEAKIIDVKMSTPIINREITCVSIYLSSSFSCLNLYNNNLISFITRILYHNLINEKQNSAIDV